MGDEGVRITVRADENDTFDVLALPKPFKTGSKGYYATTTILLHGKPYRANFLLIEIGSKKVK